MKREMKSFLALVLLIQYASFSVGDDLGFAESLGNLEGGRRRALNYRTGPANNVGVYPAASLPSVSIKNDYSNLHKKQISLNEQNQYQSSLNSNNANSNNILRMKSLMTEAASLPLGVPAFKPIPYDTQKPKPNLGAPIYIAPNQRIAIDSMAGGNFRKSNPQKIPVFQALPPSISRISNGNTLEIESNEYPQAISPQQMTQTIPGDFLMGHSLEHLAATANVSVETIKQAIFARQQQLLMDYKLSQDNKFNKPNIESISIQTTTSKPIITTTKLPIASTKSYPSVENQKVMNAPKEYYPIGYEKNFDDNFTSKVDLPHTPFNCASQKHFPGLYADINLGCMVFHVCALTDDGLIMKSFLCPESTLFDQTILKCNWWFYVDCKNSKNIYDSNIPISKSYQLMKSLTYFSNYNKQQLSQHEKQQQNDTNSSEMLMGNLNLEALRNTVTVEEENKKIT